MNESSKIKPEKKNNNLKINIDNKIIKTFEKFKFTLETSLAIICHYLLNTGL